MKRKTNLKKKNSFDILKDSMFRTTQLLYVHLLIDWRVISFSCFFLLRCKYTNLHYLSSH